MKNNKNAETHDRSLPIQTIVRRRLTKRVIIFYLMVNPQGMNTNANIIGSEIINRKRLFAHTYVPINGYLNISMYQ